MYLYEYINAIIGHLSHRELFLIARIQEIELDKLLSSMPGVDVDSREEGRDRKKRRM